MHKTLASRLIMFTFLLFFNCPIYGFSSFMTQTYYCNTIIIKEGVEIMGKDAEYSTNKKIKVFRNSEEIFHGTHFTAKDSIQVYLFPEWSEMVLEVSGGTKFVKGGCHGKRSNTNGATIIIDDAEVDYISLIGAWAESMNSGVKITKEEFILYRAPDKDL